jgi:hypothetical protein
MRLERETKGALFFRELDANGNPIMAQQDGKIGNIYVRKDSECGKAQPNEITVDVSW